MKPLVLLAALAAFPAFAAGQDHGHGTAQPYKGLETRAIKSLSQADIDEIEAGGGWGLALPAELNGKPGPAHLLELSSELDLTPAQITAIEAIHAQMRSEAIAAGLTFIAAEKALSEAFETAGLTEEALQVLVTRAALARAALRHVHLKRHLETPALLTPRQIALYARLRGYAADPCAVVPDGHDPDMWRKHNGCD